MVGVMPRRRDPYQDLNEADRALWQRVRETITPLHPLSEDQILEDELLSSVAMPLDTSADTAMPSLAKPAPAAKAHPLIWSDDDPPLKADAKRIRQGVLKPTLSLDLHGYHVQRAEQALPLFFQQAKAQQHQWVEIITGHGRAKFSGHSSDTEKGILKRLLPEWLNQPGLRIFIKRVIPAPQARGGAVWVQLR